MDEDILNNKIKKVEEENKEVINRSFQ